MLRNSAISLIFFFCCIVSVTAVAQCGTLIGQNPAMAIPVCGTKTFYQSGAASCTGIRIPSTSSCTSYNSDNSFWYKFHCYQTGTLGFVINGTVAQADYDWEVFDITGRNPNDVFTDASMMVSLNLYGVSSANPPYPNYPTGCTAAGVGNIHCEGHTNPFNAMPTIVEGHDYLLMITNFQSSGSGYNITFGGGGATANITDPLQPHMLTARAACDGTQAVIKLNKKILCNSLSTDGSEFTISPAIANVTAAAGFGCSNGYDFDSLIITLDKPLPPGSYNINIKNGSDLNTLKDYCDQLIPVGEKIPLVVYPVFPTPMDSLIKPRCAPDELQLDFSAQLRHIRCNSIAADGSDFIVNMVSGTSPVTVIGAGGICDADGLTAIIKVKLSAPIQTKGIYNITLKRGTDNNTIINECGQETAAGAAVVFATKDTVNADFTYKLNLGCKRDTINYFHDGRNEVTSWKWNFDNIRSSVLQNPSVIYASFGLKTAQLIVSNGVCRDTSEVKLVNLDNALKAAFETNAFLCPGDLAGYKDNSTGNILAWHWDFGNGNTSLLQQPPKQSYPYLPVIRDVPVQLIVTNNLGCKDTAVQQIKVVWNCYIAVPNAFSPNNDGLNDYLYPLNAYKAKDLLFRVYNRFGQLLFQTTDWTKKWDGTFKGQGADPATYVWILQYTNTDTGTRIEQKGTSILIR